MFVNINLPRKLTIEYIKLYLQDINLIKYLSNIYSRIEGMSNFLFHHN